MTTGRAIEGTVGGWAFAVFEVRVQHCLVGLRLASGLDNPSSVPQHVNSLAGAILSILCKCLEVAMLNL